VPSKDRIRSEFRQFHRSPGLPSQERRIGSSLATACSPAPASLLERFLGPRIRQIKSVVVNHPLDRRLPSLPRLDAIIWPSSASALAAISAKVLIPRSAAGFVHASVYFAPGQVWCAQCPTVPVSAVRQPPKRDGQASHCGIHCQKHIYIGRSHRRIRPPRRTRIFYVGFNPNASRPHGSESPAVVAGDGSVPSPRRKKCFRSQLAAQRLLASE